MKNQEQLKEELSNEVKKLEEKIQKFSDDLNDAFVLFGKAVRKSLNLEEIFKKDWADEVKVRELPSGLKIADLNYYEIDEEGQKKTEFTWNEAMERFKDDPDWRLPTPKELNQMALDLGYDDEGTFDGALFAGNLGDSSLEDYTGNCHSSNYWSSVSKAFEACIKPYYLSIFFDYIAPQSGGYETLVLTVRCVARKQDKKEANE